MPGIHLYLAKIIEQEIVKLDISKNSSLSTEKCISIYISIIHYFLDFVYNEQTYTCSRVLSTIVLYALLYMVRKKLDACI